MKSKTRVHPAPVQARRGPHLNALKHGLNSGSVLLPGDNVEAFRALRHREFHLYKPRNIEEARCVETITAAHWRIERCKVEQKIFKRHLGAVLSGDPDVTGTLVDADPHRLHHRGTDCNLEERRLQKSMKETKEELALLQKQRAQNLIVGNETELEDYTVFMAEGEPVVEEAAPAQGETPTAQLATTGSNDGTISKNPKGDSAAPALAIPKHWSRHQREAALRREGEGRRLPGRREFAHDRV